jgi:CubicO group peptidase (beta-lactamase class C family)
MHFISNFFIFLSFIIFCQEINADIIDQSGTRWPNPDWKIADHQNEKMASKQCQNFEKFSMQNKKFTTEGLVVIKDGELQYENYEAKYNKDTPHVLWSVSKTITGALLGTAVRDNMISLDQNLNEFYPRPELAENYQQIKIKNLFYLDSGFIWDEFYQGEVERSPVLNMLYGEGHLDIVEYASSRPIIPEGPGYKWNYSTGTPAITMGVLKKIYADKYDEMPWINFFNPLQMIHVVFERDHQGVFNGGSAAYATPRDMAKIGYMYLNHGMWNGKTILPKSWIDQTLQVSPGYLSNGTIIHDITDDGVYGGSMWLNHAVKKGFGKPYPYSPPDMFLAMGHFGQLIIILPTQNMVIARTGHDENYNSHIDEFVTRAIACFSEPNYPIGKYIPPPKSSTSTFSSIYKTLKTGIKSNIIQATVAKNICSCHFVSGLDVKTCLKRSNIPLASILTNVAVGDHFIEAKLSKFSKFFLAVAGIHNGEIANANYDSANPQYGCTLD